MLLINKPPSHNKVIISHPSQIILGDLGAIFISTRSDVGGFFQGGGNDLPTNQTQGQLLGINMF